MRVLYLDESGIGKLGHDPYLVVAGVLVHTDTQWHRLAKHLQTLLEEAVPAGAPVPKCLHAKDIYHGTGEFPRALWRQEVRFNLLDQLAETPWQFGLPVMWGATSRAEYVKEHPSETPLQALIDCYATAALICFNQTEWFMRNRVGPSEVASITMEQNRELQKRVSEIYNFIRDKDVIDRLGGHSALHEILPVTRIIDAPSYQEKTASSVLQMADFCAFAFKRGVRQQGDFVRFLKPLSRTALTWNPGKSPVISSPIWDLWSDGIARVRR